MSGSVWFKLRLFALGAVFSVDLAAATPFFPLSEVHAGLHGVGKTVFQGDKIEDFQVEILGVLPNAGPKESVILARLSGGPLEHTGVMQGMSGSPVYIDGRLLGAVALAFPYAKDPIAAIRPIEDMVRASQGSGSHRPATKETIAAALERGTFSAGAASKVIAGGEGRLVNISTPLALGGFTEGAIRAFSPNLRSLGLEPRQALSAGGNAGNTANAQFGDPRKIQPGSMISVELMQGDMNMGADGTVTYVDGDQIYAFGHRFLDVGATGIPFARSEVLTLLANVNTSFKISTPQELMGLISQDRDTAVYGHFGQRANMLPVEIAVHREGRLVETYRMNMVNDPTLTPMLLQMAVFSSIDATERTSGASTIAIKGAIELNGNRAIHLNDVYSADAQIPQIASLSTVTPVAYVLQSGFDSLQVERVSLDIEAYEKKQTLDIDEVVPSKHEVRPGEAVDLTINLTAENGADQVRTVRYRVPPGDPGGTLFFTVADGPQTSLQELKFALSSAPRTPEQLLEIVGRLRDNDKAYVRVWRAETSFPAGISELPSPPPSVALIMASGMGNAALALNTMKNSKVAELVVDVAAAGKTRAMVTGSKTVQVEVKP